MDCEYEELGHDNESRVVETGNFHLELGFSVTSVNYDLAELLCERESPLNEASGAHEVEDLKAPPPSTLALLRGLETAEKFRVGCRGRG